MKFRNNIIHNNLSQEENERFDNFLRRMLLIGITNIEHKDFFLGGSIFKGKPDIAMFRYKEANQQLLMKMRTLESVY